jgi:hypothetical protein
MTNAVCWKVILLPNRETLQAILCYNGGKSFEGNDKQERESGKIHSGTLRDNFGSLPLSSLPSFTAAVPAVPHWTA